MRTKILAATLCREVRQMIAEQLTSRPGATFLLHHGASKLRLDKTLQEQGIVGKDVVLTYTFCSTDLYAAWSFVQRTTSSAAVTCPLEGVTQIEGTLHIECLRRLPESLHKLKFHHSFNQSLQLISFPSGLQSLTFGDDFNQNLEGVTFPSGLQSLTFGNLFNQNLPSQAIFRAWFLVLCSTRIWRA